MLCDSSGAKLHNFGEYRCMKKSKRKGEPEKGAKLFSLAGSAQKNETLVALPHVTLFTIVKCQQSADMPTTSTRYYNRIDHRRCLGIKLKED